MMVRAEKRKTTDPLQSQEPNLLALESTELMGARSTNRENSCYKRTKYGLLGRRKDVYTESDFNLVLFECQPACYRIEISHDYFDYVFECTIRLYCTKYLQKCRPIQRKLLQWVLQELQTANWIGVKTKTRGDGKTKQIC